LPKPLLVLALIAAAILAGYWLLLFLAQRSLLFPAPAAAGFGTAQDLATYTGSSSRIAAEIVSLRQRFGTVEEIAAMVRLLVGPEGTFITGQTIHVNGGEFLT